MSTITLEKAVEVCREIEDKLKPIGYHCGLTGSILYKGESEKDIDIIVYPHQIKETVSLNKILDTLGVYTEMYGTQGCQKPLTIAPSTTDKLVVVCEYKGIRVDLFVLQ